MSLSFDIELPRRNFLLQLKADFGDQTIGVFGPSGAGKTSLFSLLAGLERPSAGNIALNGKIITDTEKQIFLPPNKRKIGVVFQEKLLFPHLSIKENILFGERYVKEKRIRFGDVVELLELSPLLNSMPNGVSGGEQQRAAIARALLTSPEMLLLDEPFNAVDTNLRKTMLPYLRRLRDELKIPLLVISHDLPDIQRLTNMVYLIEQGRCVGFGEIINLINSGTAVTGEQGVVNTLNLIEPEKIDEGLFQCKIEGLDNGTVIRTPFAPADSFTMTIHPEEIALSITPVPNISIQNQLRGTVLNLIKKEHSHYCIIDAGVPLIAKITADSQKRLGITVGTELYCLFKAHSLML